MKYPENWPQFFTATLKDWKPLLKEDQCKDIIIDCLKFLKEKKKVKINAYVIMNNHVHFIWQALYGHDLKDIQVSFTKHTSKQFLKLLSQEDNFKEYEVNSPDRKHAFWKRNPLGIELFTPAVFQQKLQYIHNNPVAAGLCRYPEDYKYSSAIFYHDGTDQLGLLEHWIG